MVCAAVRWRLMAEAQPLASLVTSPFWRTITNKRSALEHQATWYVVNNPPHRWIIHHYLLLGLAKHVFEGEGGEFIATAHPGSTLFPCPARPCVAARRDIVQRQIASTQAKKKYQMQFRVFTDVSESRAIQCRLLLPKNQHQKPYLISIGPERNTGGSQTIGQITKTPIV